MAPNTRVSNVNTLSNESIEMIMHEILFDLAERHFFGVFSSPLVKFE